jgi:hypothetical protein
MRWGAIVILAWLGFAANRVAAQEEPLRAKIDRLVSAGFEGRQPAPPADDAAFLRRVWLDFAGRIPTAEEARTFLADASPDKRARLIDELLAAPTYPVRMQELFHTMLMERRGDHPDWQRFLKTCFEQNKPWDKMAAAILNPPADDEALQGAGFFYTKRLENYGQNPIDYPGLTRDVGRLLLGVDLQCAQCHNHLFIDDYTQLEFQGLFAIYKNLAIRTEAKFPAVIEKATEQRLEFISVFDPTKRETGPRIPFSKEVPWTEQPTDPNAKGKPAGPNFAALPALAQELPTAENPFFTRNIANRLWFVMMGRGLVDPLDLFHTGNPPTHPELLDVLAADFSAHDFDIRWFLREIALSQAYQRSSAAPEGHDPPPRESYLTANEKRLSAEQLLWSTLAATGNRERLTQDDEASKKELEDLKVRFVKAYANEPREPETDFSATVAGALFLMNDEKLLGLLKPQPGNLMERLLAASEPQAMTDELFLSVVTRAPAEEERSAVTEYLAKNADRREAALAHVVWSMLSSMEFGVNH